MEMRAFMVHKVIGWLAGYVTIRLRDGEIERFVNMCRYKEIPLWNVYWDTKRKRLYADISLKNFWRLRPIVRKTHAVPIVVKRHGGPFLLSSIQKYHLKENNIIPKKVCGVF